jgi:hypothetical protein
LPVKGIKLVPLAPSPLSVLPSFLSRCAPHNGWFATLEGDAYLAEHRRQMIGEFGARQLFRSADARIQNHSIHPLFNCGSVGEPKMIRESEERSVWSVSHARVSFVPLPYYLPLRAV